MDAPTGEIMKIAQHRVAATLILVAAVVADRARKR